MFPGMAQLLEIAIHRRCDGGAIRGAALPELFEFVDTTKRCHEIDADTGDGFPETGGSSSGSATKFGVTLFV
jgi:hypothetical protein